MRLSRRTILSGLSTSLAQLAACGPGAAAFDRERHSFSVHDFGAAGDGRTDDSNAFERATAAAQAAKGRLIIPGKGVYRIRNWIVRRGAGAIEISVPDRATLKLADTADAADCLLLVQEDDCRIEGGVWDGNASGLPPNGANLVVKAFSGASGTPLRRLIFSPHEVRNGNSDLVLIMGAEDSHIIGGRFQNSAGNLVLFATGNDANPLVNTDTVNCSIQRCEGDRRMNGPGAQQGCFKFTQYGPSASTRRTVRCRIIDCIASMAEVKSDTGGNVPIEIWSRGDSSSIERCRTKGGVIGQSVAAGQQAGRIDGSHAIRAGVIGLEIAACNNGAVLNSRVDCDDFTDIGISLDHQRANDYPQHSNMAEKCVVHRPASRGVLVIAPLARPDGSSMAVGDRLKAIEVYGGSTPESCGLYIQNMSDVSVSGLVLDGGSAPGFHGIILDRCRGINVQDSGARRINGSVVRVITPPDRSKPVDDISVEVTTDGAGRAFSVHGPRSTLGKNVAFKIALRPQNPTR